MDAAVATQVYGRAGVAGAVGGGLLGPAMTLVVSPSPSSSGTWGTLWAVVFLSPWAIVVGVLVGGVVGGVNGLVLSHREMSRPRSTLDQRVTAFVTSVAVVVLFTWFVWCTAMAIVAVTGGVACAVLAPTVVRGR
ncbi:hypothetical protein acdb102_00330 [Acidothermaceae bacterium B102]|nr:hypothetical protein acdb102_00330 [Acidothermaceae bacterium B102]